LSPLPRRSLNRLVLTFVVGAALLPSAANAAGNPVIRDCTDDGRLSKKYTQKQYSDALKNIPTDVDEYTDCRDVIRRAQLGSASTGSSSTGGGTTGGGTSGGTGGGGGGTSGGATGGGDGGGASAGTADEALQSASSAEKAAIDQARDAAVSTPIQVGNESLNPDDLTKTDLGALSTVPTPLLIVLCLLALATATGAGSAILSRVRARRSSTAA
jgi:hypothetical protein